MQCWLTNECLILLHISCLETSKAISSLTNFRTEPSRVSSLAQRHALFCSDEQLFTCYFVTPQLLVLHTDGGLFVIVTTYLIYKDGCLYVCLYLIQIHISEPIGTKLCTHLPRGLEESVGYVWAHIISPFPPFRPILSGARADSCAVDGCRRHTASLLHYIRDAECAGVSSGTVGCAMRTRRSERNACV